MQPCLAGMWFYMYFFQTPTILWSLIYSTFPDSTLPKCLYESHVLLPKSETDNGSTSMKIQEITVSCWETIIQLCSNSSIFSSSTDLRCQFEVMNAESSIFSKLHQLFDPWSTVLSRNVFTNRMCSYLNLPRSIDLLLWKWRLCSYMLGSGSTALLRTRASSCRQQFSGVSSKWWTLKAPFFPSVTSSLIYDKKCSAGIVLRISCAPTLICPLRIDGLVLRSTI